MATTEERESTERAKSAGARYPRAGHAPKDRAVGKVVKQDCGLLLERDGKTYSVESLPLTVAANDILKCQGYGSALVDLGGRADLTLDSRTNVRLEPYLYERDTQAVSLLTDALAVTFRAASDLNSPKDKFLVNTPTGTIGVRGTVFTVKLPRVKGGDEIVETHEGTVRVKSHAGAERFVKAGHFVTMAASGNISEPIPLKASTR